MKLDGRISRTTLAELLRQKGIARQVEEGANRVRDTARGLAPVRTGTLRNSIQTERHTDASGEVAYRVGWDSTADYGFFVEVGTEDTPAQPHLRPAVHKNARGPG